MRKIPNSDKLSHDYSPIVMEASSIGSLNNNYMTELLTSFTGGIPLIPSKVSTYGKLIFPTQKYIKYSQFSEGIGEIILKESNWNKKISILYYYYYT